MKKPNATRKAHLLTKKMNFGISIGGFMLDTI